LALVALLAVVVVVAQTAGQAQILCLVLSHRLVVDMVHGINRTAEMAALVVAHLVQCLLAVELEVRELLVKVIMVEQQVNTLALVVVVQVQSVNHRQAAVQTAKVAQEQHLR